MDRIGRMKEKAVKQSCFLFLILFILSILFESVFLNGTTPGFLFPLNFSLFGDTLSPRSPIKT
jgi:hypothetical protein